MEPGNLPNTVYLSICYSAVLVLIALGLAITFGVMGVNNMAHGEMIMLGAYTAYVVVGDGLNHKGLGLNLYLAIPVAFLVVGLVGFLLEITLIRRLYGRPLDTLLATWGVSLILQQAVRLWFGPEGKTIAKPELLRATWKPLAGLDIDSYRLMLIVAALLCLLVVYVCFFRTSFGLKARAVTQNRPIAAALGISTRRIDALTFAFGSGLAGVAGCVLGPYYGTRPDVGQTDIVDAFITVILGGVGQTTGTVAGGTLIGFGNTFLATTMQNQILSKVAILLLVLAFIQFRPAGLFAPKGRVYD